MFCDLRVFFDCFLTNISIFNLVNIALDRYSRYTVILSDQKTNKLRYRAVCRPLSYSNTSLITTPKTKCLIAWVSSLLFSLPVLRAQVENNSCHLHTSKVPWLVVYLPIICFILPLTIITVVYMLILCKMIKKINAKKKSGEVRI